MSNPKGEFIWYEWLTTDVDAAQRFYGDVVGWTCDQQGGAFGLVGPRVAQA